MFIVLIISEVFCKFSGSPCATQTSRSTDYNAFSYGSTSFHFDFRYVPLRYCWLRVFMSVCEFIYVCVCVMWFKGIVNHAACLISSRSRFPTYLPTQWNYFFIVVGSSSASSAAPVDDFAPQFWYILHISLAAVRVCVNTFIYVCGCVCVSVCLKSVRPHLSMAVLHLAQQQICKAFIASLSAPHSCIYICIYICIGVRMWL